MYTRPVGFYKFNVTIDNDVGMVKIDIMDQGTLDRINSINIIREGKMPGHMYRYFKLGENVLPKSGVLDTVCNYNILNKIFTTSVFQEGFRIDNEIADAFIPVNAEDEMMVFVSGPLVLENTNPNIEVTELTKSGEFVSSILDAHPDYINIQNKFANISSAECKTVIPDSFLNIYMQLDMLSKILFAIVNSDNELKSRVITAIPTFETMQAQIENGMLDVDDVTKFGTLKANDAKIYTKYFNKYSW